MSLQKRTEVSMKSDQILIDAAISSWQQVVTRVGALCSGLNQEQLLVEVAPGKNRILYLWGHLTAVHDAMFGVLPDMVGKFTHGGGMLRVQTRANAQRAQGLALQLEQLLCLALLGHEILVASLSRSYHHSFVR